MRIGLVSYWFNRGQAIVARQIRSIFDSAGFETYILARPTKEKFVLPSYLSDSDVWKQSRVTAGGNYHLSFDEYINWVKCNGIDVVFFDQNYQFDEIARLRAEGVKTIGRFVWESFAESDVCPAKEAFDVVYSLTRCEQRRYAEFGIDSPYLRWGCHPETVSYRLDRENQGKAFLYIGGYMSARKPTGAAVKAFRDIDNENLKLTLKAQRALRDSDFILPETFIEAQRARREGSGDADMVKHDRRIDVVIDDLDHDTYMKLFAVADVALAPSRWEGLGLHLYEALSLGVPTISCNIPPINEVIESGVNGLLVECRSIGKRKNGIEVYEPSINGLRESIRALADPVRARELAEGAVETAYARSWKHTEQDYLAILSQ
jgi:glycosyltransferase involved in cell wall biosynthesis